MIFFCVDHRSLFIFSIFPHKEYVTDICKHTTHNTGIVVQYNSMQTGFCLQGKCLDDKTVLLINVRGDESVGLPLTKNMDPIPSPAFIDHHGIDNLIVPIAVGDPIQLADNSYAVDVVIHSEIISRVRPTHHLYDHLLSKVTTLVLQWVAQETGLRVNPKTVQLLPNPPAPIQKKQTMPSYDDLKKAAEDLKAVLKEHKTEETSASPFLFEEKETKPQSSKPLIQEVTAASGLKKGFLAQSKGTLYGAQGSSEGNPPKAADPLSFMPESLRERCKIVDTRVPNQVASAPKAGPKPLWSHEIEEYDSHITVKIYPPPYVMSAADLDDISITRSGISINYDQYVVRLDRDFDSDNASAKFNKKQHVLLVTCPL